MADISIKNEITMAIVSSVKSALRTTASWSLEFQLLHDGIRFRSTPTVSVRLFVPFSDTGL